MGRGSKVLSIGVLVWIAGAVILWYSLPYQPRFILPGTDDSVVAGFSPDGKILATKLNKPAIWDPKTRNRHADENGPIRLWDIDTGQEIGSFSTNGRFAEGVEFSGDGTILVIDALLPDGSERVLSIIDRMAVHELASIPIERQMYQNNLAADGRTLVLYSGPGHVKLWDLSLRRERLTLDCWPACFSPDGEWFVSHESQDSIKVRSTATGFSTREFTTNGRHLQATAISPDGSMLICDAYTGVKVWDPVTGRQLASLERSWGPKFSRNAKRLTARFPEEGGPTFKLWNTSNWRELGQFQVPGPGWNLYFVLAGPGPKDLSIAVTRNQGIPAPSLPIWMTRFLGIRSPILAKMTHELRVFDIASGKELATYSTEGEFHLAPDGRTFVIDWPGYQYPPSQTKECIVVFDIPVRRPIAAIALWPLPFALAAMLIFRLLISRRQAKKVQIGPT
jgi:WD40 repeat protein